MLSDNSYLAAQSAEGNSPRHILSFTPHWRRVNAFAGRANRMRVI
jgi:hypothetical protein